MLDILNFSDYFLSNPNASGYVTNVLNQLLESPSYVYSYDLRGNLIQQASKLTSKVMDFTWSVDNKLMQVEIKNNGTDVSGRVSFGYDALGRRILKTFQDFTSPANSYAKTLIYDREDLVMEIQDQKIKAFYVHAPGIDNPIAILRDMNDNEEFDDDEVFFYTKDHLGSIRELVGLDGKLKQRQRYSAYGVTTREKNTDQLDRLIDHAYGFTGRELDSETGLYFYRSRYYSAGMQRFLSEDVIGFASFDVNLYRYVKNMPLRLTDPKGLSASNVLDVPDYVDPNAGASVGAIAGGAIGTVACGPLCGFAGGMLGGLAGGALTPNSGELNSGEDEIMSREREKNNPPKFPTPPPPDFKIKLPITEPPNNDPKSCPVM